ncbi:MAG TPA: rod shape-determining protein MreC [Xanthomonadaceae bacterium]|nr:rod shape-determining protein MreC [Xanthomonadaceae bacterium]
MAYDIPEKPTLFDQEASATLRLAAFLLLGIVLMVADHRGGYLDRVRSWFSVLAHPMYVVASSPARLSRWLSEGFSERQRLVDDNRAMSQSLLLAEARLNRLQAVQQQNLRLRELLGAKRSLGLQVRFAELVDIDLDPFRHRIVIGLGSRDGVFAGQAVIDARGVMGQVLTVGPFSSHAILITDPSHALPVQVGRTGLRTIAFGTGRPDALALPNIPVSADLRTGDRLYTSGLGGIFPAGLPVAQVVDIASDDTGNFVVARAVPEARLERSGEVLLLWDEPAPLPQPPPTDDMGLPEEGE